MKSVSYSKSKHLYINSIPSSRMPTKGQCRLTLAFQEGMMRALQDGGLWKNSLIMMLMLAVIFNATERSLFYIRKWHNISTIVMEHQLKP